MTVLELIEALRTLPNQNARVVFTYASEVDGDTVIHEVKSVKERVAFLGPANTLNEYGKVDAIINVIEID